MAETETIIVDGAEHDIEANMVTLLLHKEPMQISVPNRFEINPIVTVETIRNLNQKKWKHYSTSQIFEFLFGKVYSNESKIIADIPSVQIPAQLEDLRQMDLGVQHISGLIILAMSEGGIKGKELFFKLPETFLHPSHQLGLADLFIVLGRCVEVIKNTAENGVIKRPSNPMTDWLNGKGDI